MIRTFIFIFSLALLITCCQTKNKSTGTFKEIAVGDYIFKFPKDFKLIKEKGLDSDVGKISNGKIKFEFDFGYYSNSFEKSLQEYFNFEVWKTNALTIRYPKLSMDELLKKEIKLIKSETFDSVNYTLFFLHKKDTILYNIVIPEEIRAAKIELDTIDNLVCKLIQTDEYVGLYLKNLNEFKESINSYLALSIRADGLNSKERKVALKILRTYKLKK